MIHAHRQKQNGESAVSGDLSLLQLQALLVLLLLPDLKLAPSGIDHGLCLTRCVGTVCWHRIKLLHNSPPLPRNSWRTDWRADWRGGAVRWRCVVGGPAALIGRTAAGKASRQLLAE